MSRGRPRLADDTIPKGIDQTKLPKGAYWDRRDRVWYTIIEEGAKKKRRKLAGPDARLSDLHRMLEEVAGIQTGTIGWLCDQFAASSKYQALAENTRRDYDAQRLLISTYATKVGVLSSLRIAALSVPFVQRVIDKIGAEFPSKANHLHRYLRRVFSWGIQRGHCSTNPAKGVEQAKERQRRRLPSPTVHMGLLAFAQQRSALKPHSTGFMSPHLWIAMELAYLCRLRGIEVLTLTDANETEEGIQTNRRKGSRDSLVLWSPRLLAAWRAAQAERHAVWDRRRMATPIKPSLRPLLVNRKGEPITRSGMNTIWQTFMVKAIYAEVITVEQRFGLHDLKRKGVTDTVGTRADKRDGSGHRSDSMMDVYDLSIPEVTTPGGV